MCWAVSAGASLGVALVILTVGAANTTLLAVVGLLGNLSLVVAACIGAGAVLMLVLALAQRVQSSVTLLILGLMVGYLTSAIVSLLLYFSIAERIHAYIAWSFGSFGGVTWSQLRVLAPVVLVGLLLAFGLTKSLNALLLGEAYAQTMGLNIRQARMGVVLGSAILAGQRPPSAGRSASSASPCRTSLAPCCVAPTTACWCRPVRCSVQPPRCWLTWRPRPPAAIRCCR